MRKRRFQPDATHLRLPLRLGRRRVRRVRALRVLTARRAAAALSVVAVVAQLPLIVLTVVAVPGSWGVGWRPTELERGTRDDPIVLDPPGKFQCIVEAAIF